MSGDTPPIGRRVLVVDDEPIMTALLATALGSAGFEVRACANAREARAELGPFDPDAAILDIALGRGPSGIDLAHVLHRSHPQVAILMLTKHPDLRTAGLSPDDLPPGCGFLRKESVTNTTLLLEAVENVLADQAERMREDRRPSGRLANLTTRQVEVLRMVAQGYSSPEIARQRGITTSAVEKLLGAIYAALGVNGDSSLSPRSEAIRIFVSEAGLPERP